MCFGVKCTLNIVYTAMDQKVKLHRACKLDYRHGHTVLQRKRAKLLKFFKLHSKALL